MTVEIASESGAGIMADPKRDAEVSLVRACIAGSEQAWTDFYCRYVGLVRSVVRRRLGGSSQDVEDLTQNVFAALVASLGSYDSAYPLTRFIGTIAERSCIQEYRKGATAKRDAGTDPLDLHDGAEEGARKIPWEGNSQEEQLERSQLIELLRHGFRRLGERCRQLLTLRYYEEMPFKEIARLVGSSENTVTVQSKRCLDELRGAYHEGLRTGYKRVQE